MSFSFTIKIFFKCNKNYLKKSPKKMIIKNMIIFAKKMKKTLLTLLTVIVAYNLFSQEVYINTSFLSNTSGIDNDFKSIYSDYKKEFIPTVGIGYTMTSRIPKKFELIIVDLNLLVGTNTYGRKNPEQYKRLFSIIGSYYLSYRFLDKEKYNLTIKSGYGLDNTTFFYSRKDDLSAVSYTCNNQFIPVNLCFGFNLNESKEEFIGIFLQYNILVKKGKSKHTGLQVDAENIPNVAQGNLSFGVKYKF